MRTLGEPRCWLVGTDPDTGESSVVEGSVVGEARDGVQYVRVGSCVLVPVPVERVYESVEAAEARLAEVSSHDERARIMSKSPVVVDAVIRAVDHGDVVAAGAVSDIGRGKGLKYSEIFGVVRLIRPRVTIAEWDALLEEQERSEGELP